jgi:hypothetical protein
MRTKPAEAISDGNKEGNGQGETQKHLGNLEGPLVGHSRLSISFAFSSNDGLLVPASF